MDRRDKPQSPRGLAAAKDAELAARRDHEVAECGGNGLVAPDFLDGDRDHDEEDEEEEEEVATRVFEVEMGGSASPWATAYLECASEGDLVMLTTLLDDGKVELNDVDVDGFTALMIAAAEAQDDVAMELLRRGADVSIRTHEMRSTALHFAAKSGATQVVEAICTQDPQRVDAQNLDGDTPLVWACTEGRVDAVRVLLAHSANVNVVSHRAMSTLICAVMLRESDGSDDAPIDADEVAATDADRAEILKLLLAKNPKLVNYQDRDGSTAMHLAASHGYLQCVMTLLEFGADITLRNAIGQTPLEEAEETGIETKSGKCIAHLRMIWKRLEEEAAARMMAMLEMEESSATASTQASGSVPRSAKKSSKKKQKKAKQRRASKANVTTLTTTGQTSEDKTGVSSGEGSSDEEEDHDDTKQHTADTKELTVPVVKAPSSKDAQADEAVKDEKKADPPRDGGVWTTVGRKHNQYLSQRAETASARDSLDEVVIGGAGNNTPGGDTVTATTPKKVMPVSPRSKTSRVTSAAAAERADSAHNPAFSARSREKSTAKKVTPAKSKASVHRGAKNYAVETSIASAAKYPPPPPSVPPPPPSAASVAESLPMNSPFSTFQRLHNTSRLYERYERLPEAATSAFGQTSGGMGSVGSRVDSSSSSTWRTHTQFSLGSSMGMSSLSMAVSPAGASEPSPAAIWRYNSLAAPQLNDRSSSFSSKRFPSADRIEPRSTHSGPDPVLRLLSCGLCGELVNENIQCNNTMPIFHTTQASNNGGADGAISANAPRCFQLYCILCLARAVGSGANAAVSCVKCRLPLVPREMKRNEFAQAQAAAMALASRSKDQHHARQHDAYEDMRSLMHRTSDRIRAAAVEPFFLVPGANLAAMSVGQLDALEELHLSALQHITQARVENARVLERLRMEEWLKTQRDVFQFASHTSSS